MSAFEYSIVLQGTQVSGNVTRRSLNITVYNFKYIGKNLQKENVIIISYTVVGIQ